jgi:TolB-like protein
LRVLAELKRRNVIRMAGLYLVGSWLVIQVAETLLPIFETPGWVLKALVVLLAIGFLPALVFSWLYELTPDGLKRDSEVDPASSIAPRTAQRMDRLLVVGLLAVVGLVAADRYWPAKPSAPAAATTPAAVEVESGPLPAGADASQSTATPEVDERQARSVAVLPFANRSAEPDTQYFVDGIHDDLITQLAKIGALRVTSRTSVNEYRETAKKIPQIAQELGVATVLEGAVQRAGNRVRITAQLILASDDSHLWAETFDRELTAENLFDIQTEIAGKIAGALQATLTPAETASVGRVLTRDLGALEAYRQARVLMWGRQDGRFDEAERLLRVASERDPGFAAAHALQSRIEISRYWFQGADEEALLRAGKRLDQARALDPEALELYLAEGYFHYWGQRDYAQSLIAIDKALRIAPGDADTQALRGFVLRRMGRFEQAEGALRASVVADPRNPISQIELAVMEMRSGDPAAARIRLGKALELGNDAGSSYALTQLARIDVESSGDLEAAVARLSGVPLQGSTDKVNRWWLAIAQGDTERALLLSDIGENVDSQSSQIYFHPDMLRGLALRAANDTAAAQAAFGKARRDLQADLAKRPHQGRRLLAQCVVLSGLQDLDAAAPVCEQADQLRAADAWSLGSEFRTLARLMSGDRMGALEAVEQRLSQRAGIFPLRYDLNPLYADLHAEPRFIAAMQRYREFMGESP